MVAGSECPLLRRFLRTDRRRIDRLLGESLAIVLNREHAFSILPGQADDNVTGLPVLGAVSMRASARLASSDVVIFTMVLPRDS